MSAYLLTIKFVREDSSIPWGFRLEGGVDVDHALNIQRVTPGGLAERFGLQAGDYVLRINNSDTRFMKHEEAKMEITRSSNDFVIVIERGADHRHNTSSTVIPSYSQISNQPSSEFILQKPVSKVSLSSNTQNSYPNLKVEKSMDMADIASAHNVNPLPYGQKPPSPGGALIAPTADGRVQRVGHSAYNSPMGLYSKTNVSTSFGNTLAATGSNLESIRPMNETRAAGSMRCGSCGNIIGGVFVKVQGRIPMHPECLKCCKCGIGLRNVGYFYINETLYCELHAKQAAPPPDRSMKPVIVYK